MDSDPWNLPGRFMAPVLFGLALLAAGCSNLTSRECRCDLAEACGPQSTRPVLDSWGDPLPPGAVLRLGCARFRHGGGVTALAFSPSGREIASASADRFVRLWDVASGREIWRASFPATYAVELAWAPDGSWLAAGCEDGSIREWRGASGEEIWGAGGDDVPVTALAISPTGKRLAVAWANEDWKKDDKAVLHLFDTPGRSSFGVTGETGAVVELAFAEDGETFVAVERSGRIVRRKKEWGEVVGTIATVEGRIKSAQVCPGAHSVAVLSVGDKDSHVAQVIDLDTGRTEKTLSEVDPLPTTVFIRPHSNSVLAIDDRGNLMEWLDTGDPRKLNPVGLDGFLALACSPENSMVAIADGSSRIRFLRFDGSIESRSFDSAPPCGGSVVARDDGFLTLSEGGIIAEWASSGNLRRSAEIAHAYRILAAGPTLAVVSSDDSLREDAIRRLDPATWKQIMDLDPQGMANDVAISGDGKLLAVARGSMNFDNSVLLWNLDSGERRHVFGFEEYGDERWFESVAFASNAAILAAGQAGAVTVFDVPTGTIRARIQPVPERVKSVALSPDGRLLAILSESEVPNVVLTVWSVKDGRRLFRWAHEDPSGPIQVMPRFRTAFSREGGLLAVISGDRRLRVWDAGSFELRAEYDGGPAEFRDFDWVPGDRRIVSAMSDSTSLVWEMPLPRR